MSKPGKVLKALCKKLGVRLTVKKGKKRVYKSVKVLKKQCAKKKKKVKRKRKFGQAPFRDFLEAPPLIRQRAQQPIDLEDRNDFNEDQIRNDPERDARIIRILYARGVPEDLHGIILEMIRENVDMWNMAPRLERQHAQQPFVIQQPFFRQERHGNE